MSDRNAVDPSNPQPTDGQELLLAKIATMLRAGLGISASDIELGAMELKDGGSDVRAKVGVLSGLLASDAGLPVTDPVANAALGTTAGAAVTTDANGAIQQYLRGLVKLIAAKIGVVTAPLQYAGVPSSFAIQTADQTVFTLAAGEIGFIQNLSADAPLAVKKGAAASTTSLNFILAACTAASDGTGGATRIDDWVGVVSVAKMAGTASYLAYKQAVA